MPGADYESPDAVEDAFHDAFERRDFDTVADVRDHEAEVG